jgi:hypothetical protein
MRASVHEPVPAEKTVVFVCGKFTIKVVNRGDVYNEYKLTVY